MVSVDPTLFLIRPPNISVIKTASRFLRSKEITIIGTCKKLEFMVLMIPNMRFFSHFDEIPA